MRSPGAGARVRGGHGVRLTVQESEKATALAAQSRQLLAMTPQDFEKSASIKDDALEVVATITTGPGFKEKHGLLGLVGSDNFLRAFIDKKCSIITSIAGSTTGLNDAIEAAFKAGIPFVTQTGSVTSPYAVNVDQNYVRWGADMARAIVGELGRITRTAHR